jgi:hypothetical protein
MKPEKNNLTLIQKLEKEKNKRKRDYDESKIAVILIYIFINYCKILIRLQHNL